MVDHQFGMLAQLVPTGALREPGRAHHDWATPFLSAACARPLSIGRKRQSNSSLTRSRGTSGAWFSGGIRCNHGCSSLALGLSLITHSGNTRDRYTMNSRAQWFNAYRLAPQDTLSLVSRRSRSHSSRCASSVASELTSSWRHRAQRSYWVVNAASTRCASATPFGTPVHQIPASVGRCHRVL